ncbi:MAG: hypothetical protein VB858_18725, partial [Planctomycetaceae bacterium]
MSSSSGRIAGLTICLAVVLATVTATGTVAVAADPAVELSAYLPEQANSVSVVRVAGILKTARAQSEGWGKVTEHRFLTGDSRIPPWVDTLVIGSLVRPGQQQEVWSTAVLQMPADVTMERIAHLEEARVERFSDVRTVEAGRGAFLVELAPRLLGVRAPAVRQEAVRWAQQAGAGTTGPLSQFLKTAVADRAHVIVAVDLRNVASTKSIRRYLEQSNLLPTDAVARVRLPQVLAALRGVGFYVTIDRTITARVTIEFDTGTDGLQEPVAAVFRHLVDDLQLSLDEFPKARISSKVQSVTLAMNLSDESLRRVMSLITSVSPSVRANDESVPSVSLAPEARPPRVGVEMTASKRYFRSVSQAIDDLARVNRKASNYAKTATWHENFARRIDQLPTAGVEPELLEFGHRVSERLRALAASLRGQSVSVNAEQQTLVYNYNYDPGWAAASYWGAVGYRAPTFKYDSNLQQVRERQAAAVVKGSQQRITVWNLITSDR